MLASTEISYLWQNGEVKPFADVRLHVLSNAVFAGATVFEGLRGYWSDDANELYVFRLDAHFQRLADSSRLMRITSPYPEAHYVDYLRATVAANAFRTDLHILYALSVEGFGSLATSDPVGMWIAPRPRGRFSEKVERGLDVVVSSWRRIGDDSMPPRLKCAANYQNGRLAILQARADGYDNALLLNSRGAIAEGAGANFFMIRRGRVFTPPVTAGILDGITRSTVIELFREEHGIVVEEREIDRTEAYLADEAFLCGTGVEIAPIASLDRLPIGAGSVGPLTRVLQKTYAQVVRGELAKYRSWVTPMYGDVPSNRT